MTSNQISVYVARAKRDPTKKKRFCTTVLTVVRKFSSVASFYFVFPRESVGTEARANEKEAHRLTNSQILTAISKCS